jgi:hypothetical protein
MKYVTFYWKLNILWSMFLKIKCVSMLPKYIKCLSWGIILFVSQVNGKDKINPRTGHEGPEGKVEI